MNVFMYVLPAQISISRFASPPHSNYLRGSNAFVSYVFVYINVV